MFYFILIALTLQKAGDFECIDDTKFKQFTSDTAFVVNSCPPGKCVTRNPPFKNPCIGKDRALAIDKVAAKVDSAPENNFIETVSNSSISDQARIDFLNSHQNQFNNAKLVPLDQPELLPAERQRTAAEGCKEAGDAFICIDLARNVRCVAGVVSKNFVNAFSENDLIKACVGGFCGGTAAGTEKGGNKCVGSAEQAVAGLNNGNEFFLPPK
jgi:hypothetical protein